MKTIIFDLDDTLLSMSSILIEDYNQQYGTNLTVDDITSYSLNNIRGHDLTNHLLEFEKRGMYKYMLPEKEAVNIVQKFKDAGYFIVFLTARPEDFKLDTKISLKYVSKLPYDELILSKDKKNGVKFLKLLYPNCNIKLFIDDNILNLENVAEFKEIEHLLLKNQPHNKMVVVPKYIKRIDSLLELLDYLE